MGGFLSSPIGSAALLGAAYGIFTAKRKGKIGAAVKWGGLAAVAAMLVPQVGALAQGVTAPVLAAANGAPRA